MATLRLPTGKASLAMIFERLRVIDEPVPRDGAWNMAMDEALCAAAREPILRVYRWSEWTVSFGYFEKVTEARKWRPGWALTRRWTGGGMVDHSGDFTYSLIVPATEELWSLSRRESYVRIHRALGDVLAEHFSVRAELVGESAVAGAGCFLRPVEGDLTLNGRKIAGAAQRRGRHFLLHQGSLQNLAGKDLMAEAFAGAWSREFFRQAASSEEENRARQLVEERYGTTAWLERS